jgi:DNA-binding MarR family transcriptional regulator
VTSRSQSPPPEPRLGAALRRAWVGYQRRVDDQMAAAGFLDRKFPDGRVLRLCAGPADMTISEIGRQLDITRQGAAKLVAKLRDLGYVTVTDSSSSGREKVVSLTPRATSYLATQRQVSRRIERELRDELGENAFESLGLLFSALAGDEQPGMRDYIISKVCEG